MQKFDVLVLNLSNQLFQLLKFHHLESHIERNELIILLELHVSTQWIVMFLTSLIVQIYLELSILKEEL